MIRSWHIVGALAAIALMAAGVTWTTRSAAVRDASVRRPRPGVAATKRPWSRSAPPEAGKLRIPTEPEAAPLPFAAPPHDLGALATTPQSEQRDDALCASVGQWARRDARAALAWCRSVEDETLKARLFGTIGFELAEQDPRAAVQLALTELAGFERRLLLASVVEAWAMRDSAGALSWAGQREDAAEQRELIAVIVAGLINVSPQSAATAVAGMVDSPAQALAARELVARWAHFEPRGAAEWLATLPEGAVRQEGLATTATRWTSTDPDAAGRWLHTLPPGPSQERAISAHVDVLAAESPRWAAEWVSSFAPSEQKFALIERVARQWFEINPAQAGAWLQRSGLPAHRRQRLFSTSGGTTAQ